MSQWKADTQSNIAIQFDNCKGGCFSTDKKYALQISGSNGYTETPTIENPQIIKNCAAGIYIYSHKKNWIPYPYSFKNNTAVYGITPTVNDDYSITLNGTTTLASDTAYVYDFTLYSNLLLPAGTYTLGGCPSGGDRYTYRLFIQINEGSRYVSCYGDNVFFTLSAHSRATISIRIGNEVGTVENLTFYPMLVSGTTIDEYETFKSTITQMPCDLNAYDIWYPVTGEVERNSWLYEVTGDENITTYTYNNLNGVAFEGLMPRAQLRAVGLCSHSSQIGSSAQGSIWYGVNNQRVYWIGILDYLGMTTIDEFVAWLKEQAAAGTPVTFLVIMNQNATYGTEPIATETYTKRNLQAYPGTTVVNQVFPSGTSGTVYLPNIQATMLTRR